MAKVDVVIAARDAERFIAEALESVLSQRGVDARVVVVDDASSDDTAAIVARDFPSVTLIQLGVHLGAPAARNVGLGATSGEYVAFFDADDVMAPGRLAAQCDQLGRHASWLAVIWNYRNFSEEGEWPQTHFDTCPALRAHLVGNEVVLDRGAFERILAVENFTITGSMMFRRSALRERPFDPDVRVGEDFLLVWRTRARGPVGICPRVAFHRRFHDANLSSLESFNLAHKAEARRRAAMSASDPAARLALRRASARFLGGLAVLQARLHVGGGVVTLGRCVLRSLQARTFPWRTGLSWAKASLVRTAAPVLGTAAAPRPEAARRAAPVVAAPGSRESRASAPSG